MITINKSANFKTVKEGIEYMQKLEEKETLQRVTITATIDKVNKEVHCRLDWVEEE